MVGSSLDGIDLVAVDFLFNQNASVKHTTLAAECYPLEASLPLEQLTSLSAKEIFELDVSLGKHIGLVVKQFINQFSIKADLISVHGLTYFHKPASGVSVQLGHGAHVASVAGIPVVCDLRSADLSYGGQGAPMVPIGEAALYPDYKMFLNLGGIANISIHGDRANVLAYDICPCNQVLNTLAAERGRPFDKNGELAAAGSVDSALKAELLNHPYFNEEPPKSLDNTFTATWTSILNEYKRPTETKLATVTEAIGFLIGSSLPLNGHRLLVTGGGAYNVTLVNSIAKYSRNKIIIPDSKVVNFKEAIVTAFMGCLRFNKRPNFLSSASGASRDSISGALYLPA